MSEYVPYSRADYSGDDEGTDFVVPFPFVSREHVALLVDGEPVEFTWLNDGMVQAAVAPPEGENNVRVKRTTPAEVTAFGSPSNFRSGILNQAFTSLLYVVQESFDASEEGFALAFDLGESLDEVDALRDEVITIRDAIALVNADFTAAYQDVIDRYDEMLVALSEGLAAQDAAEVAETNSEGHAASAQTARVGAETAETNASGHETAAGGHRTAAEGAQTAAETARDEAEAARDDAEEAADLVDERILGAFAADPTTNNDGGPLAVGTIYFNTVSNTWRVYGSSEAWVDGVLPDEGPTNASSVSFTPSGNIEATNVQAAIEELDSETDTRIGDNTSDIGTLQTAVAANISDIGTLQSDVAAAQSDIANLQGLEGEDVPFTPAGNLSSDNVQAAIEELDSETDSRLAALESAPSGADGLGYGQAWTDVTSSRALNTSYQNTTGKPIMLAARGGTSVAITTEVSTNGSDWVAVGSSTNNSSYAVVPPDHYYRVAHGASGSLAYWSELR